MKYQKIILTLIISFSFVKLSLGQHLKNVDKELSGDLLNWEYKIFNSTKEIDKHLVRLLKKEKKIELILVNPDEEFNKTDVIIPGLPNKRLIMIGKNLDNANFILYENGGNALYNVCFIYKRTKKNHYDIVALRLSNDINSLEKLRDAIRVKKIIALN